MPAPPLANPLAHARAAGALYLLVIVLGVWSELAVRAPLLAGTADLAASLPRLRLGVAADAVMVACDVALAMLFLQLLRHVQATLALLAAGLRLVQAATIAAALLFQIAAIGFAGTDPAQALRFLEVQSLGYDLGLIFFGLNTGLMALLLAWSGYVPRWLCALLGAAGAVYLLGSFSRLLAPDLNAALQPAYAVPLLAESALCLWLLIRGLRLPGAQPG